MVTFGLMPASAGKALLRRQGRLGKDPLKLAVHALAVFIAGSMVSGPVQWTAPSAIRRWVTLPVTIAPDCDAGLAEAVFATVATIA